MKNVLIWTGALSVFFFLIIILGFTAFLVSDIFFTSSQIQSESETLTVDETILSNNGTANTLEQTPTTAVTANAYNLTWLTFDGTGDYINSSSNSGLPLGQNFTVIVWVNVTIEKLQYLITEESSTISPALYCATNGDLDLRETSSTDIQITDHCTTNIGLWKMYSIRYNRSAYGIFDGATPLGTVVGGNTPLFSPSFTFGGTGQSSMGSLQGSIAEVRVYNMSLPTTELQKISDNYMKRNVSVLGTNAGNNNSNQILYYALQEGEGTTAYDLTERFYNNGTLIGNGVWNRDDVNIPLTENTDFTSSGTTFTIINDIYAWSQLRLNYDYSKDKPIKTAVKNVSDEFREGYVDSFSKMILVYSILGVMLVIGGILIMMKIINDKLVNTFSF